jgi:hypothetical protein
MFFHVINQYAPDLFYSGLTTYKLTLVIAK